jgi:signal transduction histidine kinase/CheY-like chemotaxis protein/HPt (histidine-containing phosphotransfer) domain-containing protein
VYSTDSLQIGEDKSLNPGFIGASSGQPVSDVIYRDTLNTFEGVIEHQNLIQSYLPIRNGENEIDGVFEIYSVITPLLTRITHTQREILTAVFVILALFYAILVALFARMERTLQKGEAAKQDYIREIKQANDVLEQRVVLRTQELEQASNFLQTVMDAIPNPLMVIDREYHITLMNRATRELQSGDNDATRPNYCYRILHHRNVRCDRDEHPCTLEEVVQSGQPCTLIHTHYLPNGEPCRVEVLATPLRDAEGNVIGIVEMTHDITERERAADELRQAKENAEAVSLEKSYFIASVSHEIRTPMNAVIGMTDLLRLTRMSCKQQGYTRIIQNSGEMLLNVIDSILDFSRLDAGEFALENSVFDLVEVMEEVLEMVGYMAYSKGIELAGQDNSDVTTRVSGDRHRLRQILVNLVCNAIKFTEQGEVLLNISQVSATDREVVLRFAVQDNGVGIAEADMERLFNPYTQIGSVSPGHDSGSGLGLAICKRLVEMMGGRIGVESQPGKGATFWFTLSLEKSAESAVCLRDGDNRLRETRVLIVDDHPQIAAILSDYTTTWGMHADSVSAANEALQRLGQATREARPYQVAVIDVDMPGTDGLSLVRQIRGDSGIAMLPLVLLNPIAHPLDVDVVSSFSGVSCIDKPVLPGKLHKILLQAVTGDATAHATVGIRAEINDSARERVAAAQGGVRILVAEDDAISNRMLVEMIESLGYPADSVANGADVLKVLEKSHYDLVFMDGQMPGMDGLEVTRAIRENRACWQQPVIIAVTANVSLDDQDQCLKAGMDDYFGKPIRREKLAELLRKWLQQLDYRAGVPPGDNEARDTLLQTRVWQELRQYAGQDDGDFLRHYVELFLDDTNNRLQTMATLLGKGDSDALGREAHILKGACLQFGIKQMEKGCDALRNAVRDGQLESAAETLQYLNEEFNRVRPALEAEKNRTA